MNGAAGRIGAVVRKEFIHVGRDPRLLAVVLVMPIIQLLLFAYAISFDVRNLPTVVVDLDRTPDSTAYLRAYEASGLFQVTAHETTLAAVDESFARNEARVAVVVPAGFARSLARGEAAQVGVFVDGSEPNSAKVAQTYSAALNQLYGRSLAVAWASTQGLDLRQTGLVEPRLRTWYNPDRASSIFLIPGLMVVIIMIVTAQQTAVTLVREREQGTAEQLMVSPLRRIELMVGKLTPWVIMAFLDVAVIAAVGALLFHVPMRGDLLALGVGAVLFVASCLGIGLIVSAVAPSLDTANMAAFLIAFLPAFLLSGFAFALDQIPPVLDWISRIFPARYMVTISRGVLLKGAGFDELWPQVAALAAYATVALLIAVRLHGRRT
ncbi:MAG: ABC transporter permease [Actinomycetales bacterium]|jgi:ABC-2 type transport system permease protein|nr:ABC transporter permease [Candidatus Phosphoribacter baldrii]MBK7611736.1 ABC transporter permease [Candidatus Phosphoribacter baldrii]HRC12612.1 ABC transporter permease [Dermatophilaceae bacterium]